MVRLVYAFFCAFTQQIRAFFVQTYNVFVVQWVTNEIVCNKYVFCVTCGAEWNANSMWNGCNVGDMG